MDKNYIQGSLLYYSLKDIIYNEDTIYVYINNKIDSTDNILNEMLNINIINKDGISIPFNKIDWDNIENYYMFNTIEISSVLVFIKHNLLNSKDIKVVINTDETDFIISIIDMHFTDNDNISFYFEKLEEL